MNGPDWDGEAWGNVETVDESVGGFTCPTDPALRNLCEGCE